MTTVTTNQGSYVYDAQGNLTKMVTTFDKRSTGTTQTWTTTVTYTYDTDGYLTKMDAQQKSVQADSF